MKDEKKELQKQIGCITGFFQLFDRHRFITGQRTTKYIQNASSLGVTNNGNKELHSTKQKPKVKITIVLLFEKCWQKPLITYDYECRKRIKRLQKRSNNSPQNHQ